MKITELYPEKQGRPHSPPAISLDGRGLGIPTDSITPTMMADVTWNSIVTYEGVVVMHENNVVTY